MIWDKYNYIYCPVTLDTQTKLTEPGLALDVPTILRRYAQGTIAGLSVRNPIFDDSDYPDPTERPDYDLTDADAALKAMAEKIATYKANHSKRESAAQTRGAENERNGNGAASAAQSSGTNEAEAS